MGDTSSKEAFGGIKTEEGNSLDEWLKIIMMLVLIITMIVLAIVIIKYGHAIKSNPCDFCNCTYNMVKGGILK